MNALRFFLVLVGLWAAFAIGVVAGFRVIAAFYAVTAFAISRLRGAR